MARRSIWCLLKTCCCGNELEAGAFSWAVFEIVLHLLLLPFPLLVTEISPHARNFVGWIVIVLIGERRFAFPRNEFRIGIREKSGKINFFAANVILVLGIKSHRPAFMTLWLVVYAVNLFIYVLVWVAVVIGFLWKENHPKAFSPVVDIRFSEVWESPFHATVASISFFLLTFLPHAHVYFWLVVRSLRHRLLMEMAIGFHASQHQLREAAVPNHSNDFRFQGEGVHT